VFVGGGRTYTRSLCCTARSTPCCTRPWLPAATASHCHDAIPPAERARFTLQHHRTMPESTSHQRCILPLLMYNLAAGNPARPPCLRFLNACLQPAPVLQGKHMRLVAEDGIPYSMPDSSIPSSCLLRPWMPS